MTNSVKYNTKRNVFFDDMSNKENVIIKYFPITINTRLNSFARKALSTTGLYTNVKTIFKKVLGK